MNAGPSNDPAPEKQWDENDPLSDPVWRLLARSPRPEPDAWFAARTLARCRNEAPAREAAPFVRMWRWALGGGLALSMALALVVTQIRSQTDDRQKNVQEAFEIMASIDSDSDTTSSSWQDSSF